MFIIAGSRITPATRVVQRGRERVRVVERHDPRVLGGAGREAEPVGDRVRVRAVAHLGRRRLDGDHHGVVVAVVGALDLHDHVAAGEPAREVDRVHRGLGAGVREAPVREAPAAAQLLGDDDRALGRRGEVRALVHPRLHGGGDDRVRVTDAHDAEAVVEVGVLVAVHVPHLRAGPALEVDGPRVGLLELRRHAAGHHGAGAGEVLTRANGALAQARTFALHQRGDAGSIDVLGGRQGCGHARAPPSRVTWKAGHRARPPSSERTAREAPIRYGYPASFV